MRAKEALACMGHLNDAAVERRSEYPVRLSQTLYRMSFCATEIS
jgi:hypothetical protein